MLNRTILTPYLSSKRFTHFYDSIIFCLGKKNEELASIKIL